MSRYNNPKLSKRSRGKSCPAGVRFAFRNNITNFESGTLRKSKSTSLARLGKESNFTRERRQSSPKALCDDLGLHVRDESLIKKASSTLHSENYSVLTGGVRGKLADAHKLSHSAVDVSNQHTTLNNLSPAHRFTDLVGSSSDKFTSDIATDFDGTSARENVRLTTKEKPGQPEINASCIKQSVDQDDNRNILFGLLKASEHTSKTLSSRNLTGEYFKEFSSYSDLNPKQTTRGIYPSFEEHQEQTLTDDNHLLSDFVIAAENPLKTSSTLDNSEDDLNDSFLHTLEPNNWNKSQPEHSRTTLLNKQSLQDKASASEFLTFVKDREKNEQGLNTQLNSNKTSQHFFRRFLQELSSIEINDCEDKLNYLSHLNDLAVFEDNDVTRLQSHIHGTELLVENLADQVEDAKKEIKMTAQKQENEINDLISLNEEMQTIWSAKEAEVREMLDRFSAYRSAVEADSKEKDDLFCEEINKRETLIKDLQLTKDALQDELQRQTEVLQVILNDLQNFEENQVEQLGDVNQLVACLLEKFSDQEASLVCQSISVKLETSIATIKEKDYARYSDDYWPFILYLALHLPTIDMHETNHTTHTGCLGRVAMIELTKCIK